MDAVLLLVDESESARRAGRDLSEELIVRHLADAPYVPWQRLAGALVPYHALADVIPRRPRCLLAYGEPGIAGAAFLRGCDDVLCEPWDALEALARLAHAIAVRDGSDGLQRRAAAPAGLRPSERVVFGLLARHAGRVVDRQAIERELAGIGKSLPVTKRSRRLDMLICRLRRESANAGVSIETVRGRGYRLIWPDASPQSGDDCG